jgi:hypothetical protein
MVAAPCKPRIPGVETEKPKLRPPATAARVLLNTVEQRWRRQNAALGFLCGVAALLAFHELCSIPEVAEGAGPLAVSPWC